MKKQRSDTRETQHRLLEAAGKVFADKGFWEASNADICKLAQVNTAAISYHFGGKENLYVAAWKHAFDRSIEAHPQDGGVAPDSSPEERLAGHIRAVMERMADPDNVEVEIMHKEMANPTGLLSDTIHQVMEPMRLNTRAIVKKLLGDQVTEGQIDLCEMSVMSQCMGPMLRMRDKHRKDNNRPPGPPHAEFTIEEMAMHVFRFSLAGIRITRTLAERNDKSDY